MRERDGEATERARSFRAVVVWASLVALLMAACTFDLDEVKTSQSPDAGPDVSTDVAGDTGGSGGDGSVPWPGDVGAPDVDAEASVPEAGPGDTGGEGGSAGDAGAGGGPSTTVALAPSLGLDGDGFLAAPDLCGQQVWDYYTQASYKALHVGRDGPCGANATYRTYLRFSLLSFASATPTAATLRLSYAGKTDPTAGVELFEVDDFQTLDASDWGIQHRHAFGAVIGPSTVPAWIEVDVTARVGTALAEGRSHIAFKMQYANEAEDPSDKSRWYGIRAVNDGAATAPRLVVTY